MIGEITSPSMGIRVAMILDFASFSKEEIIKLNLPQFYKDSIFKAYKIIGIES